MITPKALSEGLKESYHYENGRVVCVLKDEYDNESYYEIENINEFHFTDEVMFHLKKINNFELVATRKLVDSYERLNENSEV